MRYTVHLVRWSLRSAVLANEVGVKLDAFAGVYTMRALRTVDMLFMYCRQPYLFPYKTTSGT